MPEINKSYLDSKLDIISKQTSQKQTEVKKYLYFEGNVKPILEEAILKEFKKKESIQGLFARILPLNILRRIIEKLANVYIEAPVRLASDGNEADQELIRLYEQSMNLNVRMREHDQHWELFKKTLGEPYVDAQGFPRYRVVPAQSYYAFSDDIVSPETPDSIWKIISTDIDTTKNIYSVWTNERFLLIDGHGKVRSDMLNSIGNPDGINPYGVIPFVYITESSNSTEPIPEDDLLYCSIALPLLITDLSFASKYMAYSLLWTLNCNADIPAGPGAVMHLTAGKDDLKPEVNQIKPNVDIGSTLSLIESIVSYLLSSKGLQTDTVQGKMTVENVASGIAKAIDNSELVTQTKNKQTNFANFERDLWENRLAKHMIPAWRRSGKLNPKYNLEFSPTFELSIFYKEPRVTMSEKEKIEVSKAKLDAGFSTLNRELKSLYPEYSEDQIADLEQEIRAEKQSSVVNQMETLMGGSNGMQREDETKDEEANKEE